MTKTRCPLTVIFNKGADIMKKTKIALTVFTTTIALISQFAAAEPTVTAPAVTEAATTTSATTVLASADQPNAAANANVASMDKKSMFGISYLGALMGPNMDFHAARTKGDTPDSPEYMYLDNRPSFKVNITENVDAGLQVRFVNKFRDTNDVITYNTDYRLFSNIKKLLPTDLGSLTLTPRLVLPTGTAVGGSHDKKRTVSPELIDRYSIEPKNSRFSFNVGVQMIKYLYTSAAVTNQDQIQFYSLGIFETAFVVTPKTQITVGYYPEFCKNSDVANHTTSNETDIGVAVEVAKGWTLNPVVVTELNSMSANNNNVLKSSALALNVIGTFL